MSNNSDIRSRQNPFPVPGQGIDKLASTALLEQINTLHMVLKQQLQATDKPELMSAYLHICSLLSSLTEQLPGPAILNLSENEQDIDWQQPGLTPSEALLKLSAQDNAPPSILEARKSLESARIAQSEALQCQFALEMSLSIATRKVAAAKSKVAHARDMLQKAEDEVQVELRNIEERRRSDEIKKLDEIRKEIRRQEERNSTSEYATDITGMSMADYERRMALLAQEMQQFMQAGDMEGIIRAQEQMAQLGEQWAAKETAQLNKADSPPAPPAETGKNKALPWSAGDSLQVARQRAELRKKQKTSSDSLEKVLSETKSSSEILDSIFGAETTQQQKADFIKLSASHAGSEDREQLEARLDSYSFYEILAVPTTAAYHEIQRSFIGKVRRLLKRLELKQLAPWQFYCFSGRIFLAHDVLKSPETRLHYDVVLLNNSSAGEAGAQDNGAAGEGLKLMSLAELVKFSTLIAPKDLRSAIETMRNQPERELGHFLVQQGLLSNEELDSIFFAQKLVSQGKLSVAQYELAMQEMRENAIPLIDTLVASEWIQPQDILST